MRFLFFTLAPTGDTASALDLTVNFAQDQLWLSPTSHDVTIPAGQSEVSLRLMPSLFSSSVTQSGSLTATVAPVAGYDTSGATVQVRVISQEGPAVTVFFEESEFMVEEGAGRLTAILVARAAPGVPYVDLFTVSVSTKAIEASSGSTGDYLAVSEEIAFLHADFAEEDGSLVGRAAAIVTVLDDDVYEGDEQFGLELSRSPSLPHEISLLGVVPIEVVDR